VQGGKDITIRNLTIDGNNYQHPYYLTGAPPDDTAHGTGGNGILLYARSTTIERLVIENVWVRRTYGYGIGCQNADIASFLFNGLFLEDIGSDGIDLKAFTDWPIGSGSVARKEGILNNIHVNGFGREDDDLSPKTGLDLRGLLQVSNVWVHNLKRVATTNATGVRVNSNVASDAGRVGGRTTQLSNIRVRCIDPSANQSIASPSTGRCIGLEISAEDVSLVNYVCEGAHTGLHMIVGGNEGSAVQNVALSNIRVANARGADGLGAGILWEEDADTPGSGYSQIGPFHITNCDRGIDIRVQYLRGAGFIRNCDHGLYFVDQTLANRTWLDVMFFNNVDDVSPGVGLGYKRPAPLFLEGTLVNDPASVAAGAYLAPVAVTVPGAVAGDIVVGISHTQPGGIFWFGSVTSADTVSVRGFNSSTVTVDLPSGTLTVLVERRLHT
jgi:hypothetical protein